MVQDMSIAYPPTLKKFKLGIDWNEDQVGEVITTTPLVLHAVGLDKQGK